MPQITDQHHEIALLLAKEHTGIISRLDIINFLRRYDYVRDVIYDYYNPENPKPGKFTSADEQIQPLEHL